MLAGPTEQYPNTSDAAMWRRRLTWLGAWSVVSFLLCAPVRAAVAERARDPVVLSVVAVNPSDKETKTTPVRIDLPQEVTPKDVIDTGELKVEYDDEKKLYYVFKDQVALAPKETRVFEVVVKDLWYLPAKDLNSLREYTNLLLKRLEKTTYYNTAKGLAESIMDRLQTIDTEQNDDSLSRKTRIGNYRHHKLTIVEIKDDLARMEKLLTFIGGPPVPEMLEKSPLKSDSPSRTTTWLVILLIVVFIGLIGGQFFFTWHRKSQVSQELDIVRQAAFPSNPPTNGGTPSSGKGGAGSPPIAR